MEIFHLLEKEHNGAKKLIKGIKDKGITTPSWLPRRRRQ